ncbi:hypothetical protein EDB84DRAFT_1473615 [Lactarius hengduanensis]|nr:hypothetical protein EDB84DRAFT_1473615 [Lactarius hengduanensis]
MIHRLPMVLTTTGLTMGFLEQHGLPLLRGHADPISAEVVICHCTVAIDTSRSIQHPEVHAATPMECTWSFTHTRTIEGMWFI